VALDLDGVDLTTEVLRTDRLVLRPARSDDVDEVFRACQDAEMQRWVPVPVPYTRDDAAAFVGQRIEDRAERIGLSCVVEADGRFVGTAGLSFSQSLLGPGVGYTTAPWARGRGYAAEAARALAEWAFAHLAHRVHLLADVGNVASQVVARRAGFVEEGRLRACLPYRDHPHGDAVLFSRLPSDPAGG